MAGFTGRILETRTDYGKEINQIRDAIEGIDGNIFLEC